MRFDYRYYGTSSVSNGASSTEMRFAPDTLRPPTHFVANVSKHIPFREAISALHEVVVADERYQAPDKSVYKAWLAQNEEAMMAEYLAREPALRAQIPPLQHKPNGQWAVQRRLRQNVAEVGAACRL